jgi:hypothetical protein
MKALAAGCETLEKELLCWQANRNQEIRRKISIERERIFA